MFIFQENNSLTNYTADYSNIYGCQNHFEVLYDFLEGVKNIDCR